MKIKMDINGNQKFMLNIIATIGVCVLGGFSMYLTKGETGIGWAILGILIIWA